MDAYPLLHTLSTPALGLATWEVYDPSMKVHLTSTALRLGEQLFLFDPIPLPEGAEEELFAEIRPTAILLTSGNHERHALALAEKWQLPIYAPAAAFTEFSRELAARALPFSSTPSDPGEHPALPYPLETLALTGGPAGETAYYTPAEGGIAVVGDALIHLPTTGFCLLPEKYCEDMEQLRESVKTLASRPLAVLAFAHGRPLLGSAGETLAEKIASLPE